MLLPAKPSAPSSIAPEAMADWNNPDFTITIPGYYTSQYSKHAAQVGEYMAALGLLKTEAAQRGYSIHEYESMATMCKYVHFRRTGPAVAPPAPKLAIEETPVIDVEEVRDVKRIS